MTESWITVSTNDNYEVSDEGRVRNVRTGRVLKGYRSGEPRKAYMQVDLFKNGQLTPVKVHRLVATAFIGNIPIGMQVNHMDANKMNNRADNLEIVTPAENMQHASRMGLLSKSRYKPSRYLASMPGGSPIVKR